MHKDIRFQAIFCWIRHPAFLLFLSGGTSLVIGTLLAASTEISSFSWMRLAADSQLSIVGHIVTQLLPFLIAAYAVYISKLWLLLTVCSCKLFSFAYMGSLIWFTFGSAAWLVRMLLLFSDIILVPMLCWFGFKQVIAKVDQTKDLWICISIVCVTALINLLFISPFLERVINIS